MLLHCVRSNTRERVCGSREEGRGAHSQRRKWPNRNDAGNEGLQQPVIPMRHFTWLQAKFPWPRMRTFTLSFSLSLSLSLSLSFFFSFSLSVFPLYLLVSFSCSLFFTLVPLFPAALFALFHPFRAITNRNSERSATRGGKHVDVLNWTRTTRSAAIIDSE